MKPVSKQPARSLGIVAGVALCLAVAAGLLAPAPAWARGEEVSSDPYEGAASAAVEDGEYLIDVDLEGGTGRADVRSPAKLTVVDGLAAVALEWSSPNYDYMVVGGKTYLPVNAGGNSIFMVPVLAFDEAFDVAADTTAMSEPHEIDYTLLLHSASIQPASVQEGEGAAAAESADGAGATVAEGESSAGAAASGAADAGAGEGIGGDISNNSSLPWGIILAVVVVAVAAVLLARKFGVFGRSNTPR